MLGPGLLHAQRGRVPEELVVAGPGPGVVWGLGFRVWVWDLGFAV